ncbi:hypothetical protein MCEGE14_00558 [Burkholderiaceae bacterium]
MVTSLFDFYTISYRLTNHATPREGMTLSMPSGKLLKHM